MIHGGSRETHSPFAKANPTQQNFKPGGEGRRIQLRGRRGGAGVRKARGAGRVAARWPTTMTPRIPPTPPDLECRPPALSAFDVLHITMYSVLQSCLLCS